MGYRSSASRPTFWFSLPAQPGERPGGPSQPLALLKASEFWKPAPWTAILAPEGFFCTGCLLDGRSK